MSKHRYARLPILTADNHLEAISKNKLQMDAGLASVHFLVNICVQSNISKDEWQTMSPQIFLVAPMIVDTDTFTARLSTTLDVTNATALLLPKGARDDNAYEAFAKTVLPLAQTRNCAVLIENDAALAKRLGADGVHVTGDLFAVQAAVTDLKPDMIVGAGNLQSRHDTLEKAEAGADYLFFGALSGKNHQKAFEEASWWAETAQVPAVLSEPETTLSDIDTGGCEFIALSDQIWARAETPVAALRAFAVKMENL